ncbi:MAG TPA: Ig-like domain-containing protein [Solirubrobacteraceae bacterium]|jgi:uncharacterized repeat protein (TIGR02543 family)
MGAVLKPGRAWVAGLAAMIAVLALGAGAAQAATCTDNWTGASGGSWYIMGNWSAGLPTNTSDVCINNSTVNIDGDGGSGGAQARSLTLTGSTLNIAGGTDSTLGSLDVATGNASVDSTSSIVLTELCSTACSAAGSSLTVEAGTLTNQGTITSAAGTNSGSGRAIFANATNSGSVLVNAPLLWSGGAVENQGMISVPNGTVLTIGNGGNTASLTNDSGGLITNNGGSGDVSVGPKATFTQGAGTMSPSSPNPAHPAVIVDNSGFGSPAPTLAYTGTAASAIEARGTVNLSGDLAAGQSLNINGVAGCPSQTLVTASAGFTNAGTLTLGGTCDSGLKIVGGTLINSGTLTAASTPGSITREIDGNLTNSGTFNVDGATAFDGSGATLTQTAGTTTIAPGAILDTSGSGATFQLQGGVLTGGGQTQATAAIVNGSVSNTGANIIPGSTSSPGLMTFDGSYAQAFGGKLTEVVDGAGGPSNVGTGYSQLGATGSVSLSGTLAIATVSNPNVGDLDTILATNGTVSGTFSTVTGAFTPGSSFGYRTSYGSNYAALSVGPTLRVTKSGAGTGTVTSSPAGISCGSTCFALFFGVQNVTLTAHPASGSVFAGWSGACTGPSKTCQVSMTQARTVTAKFSHPTTTTTKLSSSHNPSKVGRKVTYTATVSPHPRGGTVRFTSGGTTIKGCGAVHVNGTTGRATCSVTYHSTGARRIRATYSGAGIFARSSSSTLTERVRKR